MSRTISRWWRSSTTATAPESSHSSRNRTAATETSYCPRNQLFPQNPVGAGRPGGRRIQPLRADPEAGSVRARRRDVLLFEVLDYLRGLPDEVLEVDLVPVENRREVHRGAGEVDGLL